MPTDGDSDSLWGRYSGSSVTQWKAWRRGFKHALVARLLSQQRPAKFERVLLCGCREFIDETFDEKEILRMSNRAPQPHLRSRFAPSVGDALVRDVVGMICDSFHRKLIDAAVRNLHEAGSRHNRR